MGRRSAPQPLALAEDVSSSALSEESKGPLPSTATTAATLASPESTAPGITDRPSPSSLFAPDNTLQVLSPSLSNKSPKSPRSPFSKFNPTRRPQTRQGEPRSLPVEESPPPLPLRSADDTHLLRKEPNYSNHNPQNTPAVSSISQSTTSPNLSLVQGRNEEKHTRSGSRFFNFGKGARSNNQLQPHTHTASNSEAMSRGLDLPIMAERVPSKSSKNSDQSSPDLTIQKPAPVLAAKSDVPLPATSEHEPATLKKSKPKPFTLLGRNRSFKEQDGQNLQPNVTIQMTEPEKAAHFDEHPPLKTAPINPEAHDRSFRNMMNSSTRNHSADRAFRDTSSHKEYRNDKENRSQPPSIKDNGASTFFGGLRSSGSRAADMISKGLFGKGGRSASTSEREPVVDDEHYILKVINLPLVEQTRKTRISKRLEESRDKTEFWMPAFPWRAIDYLNFNGTDVEGLYRVPGSGPQIKKWQRRFDEEYDVDLFAQDDLYDINIIGSMLKAWLRELPDELFPKEAQERISRNCAGSEKVPQMLIDELSNLPPFKYYLLFAVTCHLSLLLAHSDKNKMDFRNLCICFQPCMKIDAFCFKFLVCDWRLCWQGCRNEAKYIEEEYKLFQQPLPRGLAGGNESPDDRTISSSDGSKCSVHTTEVHNGKPKKKALASSQSSGNLTADYSSSSPNQSIDREVPSQQTRELRPLSPIKPLSPMNF
ncbi:hypothetical protein F5B22DRAFT_636513 [Xylaria bambusicola]|uniref:uncharacterized protein n=1 Tax=Xylaria bambusicola TaxID=326684 RepID=UPI002008BEE9|nr:uncharacterized protein F5B22DRAFT_636513 [Xylaria bambusicola]KAI0515207.1 hypothetical protein F5B22DRAFT_636513 [Xylaria bambusicola]